MCQRLGTPNTPANPFHAGGEFRGFHGSLICYGLPGCSAPCTDLTGFPAIGAFYFQASNEIGPLLDITTASTGLLCWRDFHPQEWQLDSLHGTDRPSVVTELVGSGILHTTDRAWRSKRLGANGRACRVARRNFTSGQLANSETADALDFEMVHLELVQRTMERNQHSIPRCLPQQSPRAQWVRARPRSAVD